MSGQDAGPDVADAAGNDAAEALAAARTFYHAEGLRLPPLPRELAARLAQFDDAEWGLAPADAADADAPDPEAARHDLTDRPGFLDRATDPTTPDEIGFGYVGHGVSSWWMCYQLIRGPLALFIRQGYGGPYSDPEAPRRALTAAFRDADALIVMADAAAAEGVIAPGQRLVVVADSRDRPCWGRSDDPEGWQGSEGPISAAIEALQTEAP
jgi:hypothetical protein